MQEQIDYFKRIEVANSDLSWLKNLEKTDTQKNNQIADIPYYYKYGSLFDAMLTDNTRMDYFKRTLDGEKFSKVDFKNAENMKRAFLKDEYCLKLLQICNHFQKISVNKMLLCVSENVNFEINSRRKYDMYSDAVKLAADIKSTTAKTQKQFETAFNYFDYDRQTAWYMDGENLETFVVIGISKVNHKVFKIFINRDSPIYKQGKEKYLQLAFRWYLLFGTDKTMLI